MHKRREDLSVEDGANARGRAILEPELALFHQGRRPDLEVTLPWPPSVNRYWGHRALLPRKAVLAERIRLKGSEGIYEWLRKSVRVRDYLRPDGEIFKEEAAWRFKVTRKRFGSSNCAVWLDYHPPRRGSVDCANFDKGILDAAEWAGVVDNDAQLQVALFITKGEVVKGGEVNVRIWKLG